MSVEIGAGLRKIWIVWRRDSEGPPNFLAAYDGERAQESAVALVDLLKRTRAPGEVSMAAIEVWPLLKV